MTLNLLFPLLTFFMDLGKFILLFSTFDIKTFLLVLGFFLLRGNFLLRGMPMYSQSLSERVLSSSDESSSLTNGRNRLYTFPFCSLGAIFSLLSDDQEVVFPCK